MAKVRKRSWKNKDGKVSTCWFADFTDKSGKRIKQGGFRIKAEAEEYMLKALSSNVSSNKESKTLTVVNACSMYIELHAEIHCKITTCCSYKGYLNNHIKPFFKNLKVQDLTKIKVEQFIKAKKEEGLSTQMINHLITLLKATFQKMIDDELIHHNPLLKVKKPRIVAKKFDIIDSKEVEILLNTAKEHYPNFYPLIFTAIFTGMRQGELFALQWNKIDWLNRKILIDSNFTRNQLTTPKSNKSRVIDMSGELFKVLREWQLRCSNNDKNLVFPNKEGNYLDPNNLNKRLFHPLLEKAETKKIRFHDLRHTFASLLITKNISIKYIQSQMGHSSIQMTMDIYGHILPEVTLQGVNALDSILKQNGTIWEQNEKMAIC